MTDLLDSILAQLRTRLEELRPLARECERLQEAQAALADGPPTGGKRGGQSQLGGARARLSAGGRSGWPAGEVAPALEFAGRT